jgi:hypothetical protein
MRTFLCRGIFIKAQLTLNVQNFLFTKKRGRRSDPFPLLTFAVL